MTEERSHLQSRADTESGTEFSPDAFWDRGYDAGVEAERVRLMRVVDEALDVIHEAADYLKLTGSRPGTDEIVANTLEVQRAELLRRAGGPLS